VRLYLQSGMRKLVDREMARFSPHVVHATLARMAPYLPRRGRCHRHLDLVDALSLNMESRAMASGGPARLGAAAEARLLRRFEARSACDADSCSLASEFDRRAAPGLEGARVIGNGVDLDAFPFLDPAGRAGSMLFFGNLGYFHNVEPARFGAREVLPRVRAQVSGADLRIAGARPSRAVRRLGELDGVTVVGPVDDMARELHRARVALLPMFSGSGVKNKVLEAFCAGTPVVTNEAGIRGLDGARAGRHYLAGETPAELAAACTRLLADPRLRRGLAREAFALVRREFTWDRKIDALLELYHV
jgi:glycosyltransferase involved in cell wall biosynthesis